MSTDERKRILDLLDAGVITPDQATNLLGALAAAQQVHQRAHEVRASASGATTSATGATSADTSAQPRTGAKPPPLPVAAPPKPRPPARLLRITVDARENGNDAAKVRVNVPLQLARFASRFLPQEARAEFDGHQIDLGALLEAMGDEVPEGRLVDVDARSDDGTKSARIVVEVV